MIINVSDVVLFKDNKVLMVQERKPEAYGLWNFPGGKNEKGETPEQGAYREIKEELNAQLLDLVFLKKYTEKDRNITFNLHIYTGRIEGPITIQDEEIMAYGWFSLESIELMQNNLRGITVLEQARDAFASIK